MPSPKDRLSDATRRVSNNLFDRFRGRNSEDSSSSQVSPDAPDSSEPRTPFEITSGESPRVNRQGGIRGALSSATTQLKIKRNKIIAKRTENNRIDAAIREPYGEGLDNAMFDRLKMKYGANGVDFENILRDANLWENLNEAQRNQIYQRTSRLDKVKGLFSRKPKRLAITSGEESSSANNGIAGRLKAARRKITGQKRRLIVNEYGDTTTQEYIPSLKERVSSSNLANSVKVAGYALRYGDPRTAIRALTPDAIASRLSNAREGLSNTTRRVSGATRRTSERLRRQITGQRREFIVGANGETTLQEYMPSIKDRLSNVRERSTTAIVDGFNAGRITIVDGFTRGTTAIVDGFTRGRTAIVDGFNTGRTTIMGGFRSAGHVISTGTEPLRAEFQRIAGIIRAEGPRIRESFATSLREARTSFSTAGRSIGSSLREIARNIGAAGAGIVAGGARGAAGMIASGARGAAKAPGGMMSMVGGMFRRKQPFIGPALPPPVDANGNPLPDPDGKGKKRSRMGMAGQGVSMALMMGTGMVPLFADDEGKVGGFDQKEVMGATMIAGLIASLPPPLMLAAAALTALVAPLYLVRRHFENLSRESAELGANMGGSKNRMEKITSATGYQFARGRMNDLDFRFTKKEGEGVNKLAPYFESEEGKKQIADLKKLTVAERYKEVASIISMAIADGMDVETAKAYGNAIAAYTNDALLKNRLTSDFKKGSFKSGPDAMLDLIQSRVDAAEKIKLPEPVERATSPLARQLGTQGTVNLYGEGALSLIPAVNTLYVLVSELIDGGASQVDMGRVFKSMVPGLTIITETIPGLQKFGDVAEETAKIYGSSIQTLKEVKNAEALITEERRKGNLTSKEYAEKMAQVRAIQDTVAGKLEQAFTLNEETGLNKAAIKDQLVMSGFEGDLADSVANQVNKIDIGEKLFGDKFDTDDAEQNKVIAQVMTQILSGITPENAAQQLAEIESIYAVIAQQILTSAKDGILSSQDVKGLVNKSQIEQFVESQNPRKILLDDEGKILGGFRQSQSDIQNKKNIDLYTKNLVDAEAAGDFENAGGVGVITNKLAAIGDAKLLDDIQSTTNGLKGFSEIVTELNKPENRNIDLEISTKYAYDQDIKPAQLTTDLEKLNAYVEKTQENFSKRFGKQDAAIIKEMITSDATNNAYMDAVNKGTLDPNIKNAEDLYGKTTSEADRLLNITKNNVNKDTGKITMTAEVVTELFGVPQESADAAVEALSEVFGGRSLSPLMIPMIATLMFANPEAFAVLDQVNSGPIGRAVYQAKKKDITATTYSMTKKDSRGYSTTTEHEIPKVLGAATVHSIGLSQLGASLPGVTPTNTGGGGSNPLADFKKNLLEQIKLYSDLKMTLKKLFSEKNSILGILATNNGLDDKLRAAGLNETLVQTVLGMGSKAANKWISKNISGGRLNAAGRAEQVASRAVVLGSLESQSVGAINDAKTQMTASRFLQSGKYGEREGQTLGSASPQVLSMISGSPALADAYVGAINEIIAADKKYRDASKGNKKEAENTLNNKKKNLQDFLKQLDKSVRLTSIADQLMEARKGIEERRVAPAAKASLNADQTLPQYVKESIMGDANTLANYKYLLDERNRTAAAAKKRGKGKKKRVEDAGTAQQEYSDFIAGQTGDEELGKKQSLLDNLNKERDALDKIYKKQTEPLQEKIDLINKEIEAVRELNDNHQDTIRSLSREKEMLERQVEVIARKNETDQKSIEKLQREDELRTRVADALNHELSVMSEKETKIREAYDKRIKALDEVAKINDYIINQQKSQLGLADALSRGDISAAVSVQQDMQAGNAQFATEQMRTGLQTGVDNQIEGLTTSGGLTRVQAEDQIRAIGQQTYQTSLLVRDLQDAIYSRNLDIAAIKIQQRDIDDSILKVQDLIYANETNILGIQNTRLEPLQKQLTLIEEEKAMTDKLISSKIDAAELDIEIYKVGKERVNQVDDLANSWIRVAQAIRLANEVLTSKSSILGEMPAPLDKTASDAEVLARDKEIAKWRERNAANLQEHTDAIAAANALTTAATAAVSAFVAAPVAAAVAAASTPLTASNGGGQGMMFATGGVVGQGGRDSVPSMLTPGEFVMRKASVQKYGAAMFERMNMGAFDMPRYNVQGPQEQSKASNTNNTSINAPVYNTYSVNVNVPNTNADPDVIANKVMMRMTQIDNSNIRSLRGNK